MSLYLQGKDDNIVIARNTTQPKMGQHGHTWDNFTVEIDGEETKLYLDTTWGEYMYFEKDGKWYKITHYPMGLNDTNPSNAIKHPEWGNIVFEPYQTDVKLQTVERDDWRQFLQSKGIDTKERGI